MLFLLAIFVIAQACWAGEVLVQNITTGNIVTIVTYTLDSTAFIHTQTVNNTVYVVGVEDGSYTPTPLVCQPSTTTRIVIGQRGCGPNTGNTNCATNPTSANQNKLDLEEHFYLNPESAECVNAVGPDRAALSCFGPVYVNLDDTQGPVAISNETLIIARYVYVLSGDGYNCRSPAVTPLDIFMPSLYVNATGTCASYTGEYVKDGTYPFQRLYVYTSGANKLIFYGNATQQLSLSDQFWFNFTSGWNYRLPTTYGNGSCSFTLSMVPIDRILRLKPRETLDSTNYYLNRLPLFYERQSICNFEICATNDVNTLKDPYCLPNTVRGGYDAYRTNGAVSVPVHVVADPAYASYVSDCDSFWPWSPSFQVYSVSGNNDGPFQSRYIQQLFSCFAPFYDLEAINSVSSGSSVQGDRSYNEKFKQCANMNGFLVSDTHCQRQADMQGCELGWVYFKGYCYKYFNPNVDQQYRVSDLDADIACASFGADVTVYRGFDSDIKAWLQNSFVAYKRPVGGFPYRLPVQQSSCLCLDRADTASVFSTNIGPAFSTSVPCACEDLNFPICRYQQFSRPLPHYFVGMSPDTRRILREGQTGINWNGQPGTCTCYAGSGGDFCQQWVCAPPTSVFGTDTGNVLNDFFARCYFGKRGVCFEQNPRSCVCEPGYGPPASLIEMEPFSTEFVKFPCACPMSSVPSSNGFIANGVFYRDSPYAICGGSSNGECTYENGTTISRCLCRSRVNTWNGVLELAMNGKACTCQVAMIPYQGWNINGPINTGFCNSKGVCCSSGEIQTNQRFPGQDTSLQFRDICTNNDLTPKEGCQCNNGWTGTACTCPNPYDEAFGLRVQTQDFAAYVNLVQPLFIVRVTVGVPIFATGTCTAVQVTTQNALDRLYNNCTYNPGNTWSEDPHWSCPIQANATQFVVVYTTEQTPTCSIQAYTRVFPPCGFNTLPYVAAFWALNSTQGIDLNAEVQSIRFAPKGCSNTECFCDPDHTGPLCSYGISSKRNGVNAVCGETTLPQRGKRGVEGCDCYKNEQLEFVRDACECVEVEGQMCAGHGVCRNATFALGRCSQDLSDYLNDPLSNPFSNVTKAITQFSQFTLLTLGYISVNGETWQFYSGQSLGLSIVNDDIDICKPMMRYEVNMSYVCPDNVDPPIRVWATTTQLSTSGVFTVQDCDPSSYTGLLQCDAKVYCIPEWGLAPPVDCIYNETWKPLPISQDVLLTGNYSNVVVLCARANVTDPATEAFPYGVLDCSNKVQRVIDDQLVEVQRAQRQCSYAMTAFNFVRGAMYGLFDFEVFDMNAAAQVASLLNNTYCFAQLDFRPLLQAYLKTWITLAVDAETQAYSNQPANTTFTQYTNTEQDFFFDGAFGSEVLANLATWPVLTANFTFPTRAGLAASMPSNSGEQVVQYAFVAQQRMAGLQVYGESGLLCATYLRDIMPGETIVLNCLVQFTPVPLVTAMTQILLNSSFPNKTQMAQAYVAETPVFGTIWYNTYNQTLVPLTNFSVVSRGAGFVNYWNDLTYQIVEEKTYPPNQVYVDACDAAGQGRRPINLTTDFEYLRDFWYTYLAPRRCGDEVICQTAGRGTCVPDLELNQGWLNGDFSPEVAPQNAGGVVGNEGGCDCDSTFELGFWSFPFFCSKCSNSYGPGTQNEVFQAILFQEAIQEKYSNASFFPLYNPSVINISKLCVYPSEDSTTQDTLLCAGRGEIKQNQQTASYNVTVFPNGLLRRCTALIIHGSRYVLQNTTNTIEVSVYLNGTNVASVIQDALFLDAVELGSAGPECNDNGVRTCEFSGVEVECVDGLQSEIYNVELDVTIVQLTFFLSRLVFG